MKMRMTSVVAGLAFLLASCGGGEKKTEEQGTPPAEPKAAPAAPAPAAPPAARQTHDVNMVLDGSSFKYVPDALVIRSGDVVRFKNKSGGPHNVAFWVDSIPRGAVGPLQAGMAGQTGTLEGPLLIDVGTLYEVNFARTPKGVYNFYCTPHVALGMRGNITVE